MKSNWKTFKANSKNLQDRLNSLTEVWFNFHVHSILPGPLPGTYLIVMMRTHIIKNSLKNLKPHDPSRRNVAS